MLTALLRRFVSPDLILFLIGLLLGAPMAFAGDAPGCRDAADLKRFEGSAIVLCAKKDFAEYNLPTGRLTAYDFNTKKGTFVASLDLEGRLTQNVLAVPKGPSAAEVFRNYKLDLEAKGYQLLYEGKQAELGPDMGHFFENMGPGTQIWGYSPNEARYLAAFRQEGEVKVYIGLYVVEYAGGYEPKFSPQPGQVMVRLDAMQVGELKDRMVLVTAADIAKGIDQAGHVAFYGINFDTNKATIRPDSRPALDEIAKYMKAVPNRKFYVIGHTDNAGGFDYNMTLSRARAASVVAELAGPYGIPAARLAAGGVGLQAPVASNETEEGRAKNRRVELIPQ